MARKFEIGLKYFSHDIDMAHDRSMRKVTKKFSAFGYGVYCRILECIYKDGHYVKYDDEFVFDILDSLNMDDSDTDLIKSIVAYCVEIGLFDSSMFEQYSILTSHGIQVRYFMAKETSITRSFDKNNTPEYKYLLVDIKELFSKPFVEKVDENEDCFDNNENCFENNSIDNETMPQIKINKNKLNNTIKKNEDKSSQKKSIEERKADFIAMVEPYREKFDAELIDDFIRYWTEPTISGKKMLFETKPTWSTGGRLATFQKNKDKWNHNNGNTIRPNNTPANNSVQNLINGLSEISKTRRNSQ